MKRVVAMTLLCLGCLVAATGGARNGPAHTAYRTALGVVPEGGAPTVSLPGPTQRLTEWLGAGGAPWALGIGMVIAGALLARKIQKEEATSPSGSAGEVDFGASMEEALRRLSAVKAALATLPMDDDGPQIRAALDALTDQVLEPVVAARGRFAARHGMTVFAAYFGSFAAGEWTAARCWSALVDGHAEVARDSLAQAVGHFEEALAGWRQAEAYRGAAHSE